MKLSQRQLRRLIEAEVDRMRVPRGPNSRDDGERDLTEDDDIELAEHLREEVDPAIGDILTVARDLEHYIREIYDDMESSESGTEVGGRTVDALAAMQKITDNLIRHYSMLDKAARRPPATAGKGHFIGSRWVPED